MTDLDEMERRIRGIFGRAGKELKAKWDDWMKDMDKELEGLQKAYEAAKASGDGAAIRKAGIALSRAKKDKIMGNKYYDQMVAQSAERLKEAQQQAMAYINGQMPRVYATSFNGSTAQIADGVPGRMGISFDLADESTVARLMRDPSMDLHDLTRSVSGAKIAAWNNRAISSEITQGIVQGDSIPRIAGRLMNVAGMDMKAATRTARTMTTGAENAGREDSYHRAQDMGIKMKQQWVASLDDRTRHTHRMLDGEVREVGEPFSNGLRFPGDPYGPPEEVYNCRCTLIAVLDGFDRDKVERWNKLEDQSYEEWKAGGSVQKPNENSVIGTDNGKDNNGNDDTGKEDEIKLDDIWTPSGEYIPAGSQKEFMMQNMTALKEAGVKNSAQIREQYENTMMHEAVAALHKIPEIDAVEIAKDGIPEGIRNKWFVDADSSVKPKILDCILGDPDVLNAGWNIAYRDYAETVGSSDVTFEQFLRTPITLYRGTRGQAEIASDVWVSFSMDRNIALKFGDTIEEITIRPIDTWGAFQTTAEAEILVPKRILNQIRGI